ncbi:MAG: hypothetical protein JNL72_01135 [Flavipsychrobacter sp.]|nr:hypothetical protein [Flavipsychrobacter sp.]
MKKQTMLLLAGGLLTFASCTNEQAGGGGFTQEYVDSAVTAIVAERQAELQASNDSMINVMAQWKADSMIAAAKGAPAPTKPRVNNPGSTAPTTTTPPPPPKPTEPAATGKNNEAQKNGEATGKNNEAQKQSGEATGKKR